MIDLKVGDIIKFDTLPEWAEYENIYFIVNNVTENEEKELDLDVGVIVEFEKHMVKGENTGMTLNEEDMEKFSPSIVEDDAIKAKILLVE